MPDPSHVPTWKQSDTSLPPWADGAYGVSRPPYPPGSATPTAPQPPHKGRGRGSKVLLIVLATVLGLVVVCLGAVVHHVSNQKRPVHTGSPWQRVADKMTAALAAKDEQAFLSPFTGEEVEKQRRVFRNLVKIPWETARWETEFAVPMDGRDMMVTFVHQVQGVDVLPVPEVYNWRVEGGDTPTITAVGGSKDLKGKVSDGSYYPAPWDYYDDLTVEHRDHLVVVAGKAQGGEVTRDIDLMAQAAHDDLEAWNKSGRPGAGGREAARGFFVVLEKDRAVYNRLYSGEGRDDDALEAGANLALPAYDSKQLAEILSGGSRIVMDTAQGYFTGTDWRDGVTEISRHEMGHAIVAPFRTEAVLVQGLQSTRPWVVEGFAEYMAMRDKGDRAQSGARSALSAYRFDGHLPDGLDVYADDGRARDANYDLAGLAIAYLAETYGEDKAFAFVAAHYAKPKEYEQQIAAATGLPLASFEANWATYVRAKVPTVR
ncbi:hypothetical protein GCM10018781_56130 [Kitasatospora indigofera]|uniref:Peptidase n=1 Tax=Kitasatospora indigofera TaxID=67307 RepID=A0A919G782_9ACTN|nr:hypothetical protein [Kitasatospora indigofera]GHH79034.1 hypothetical protein GCM10018781_56130 [Kitasatospora indigofera]